MSTEFTKLDQVALIALQGLLASGHYTQINETEGTPEIVTFDIGADYKDEGHPHRFGSQAASDAFYIARDFLHESDFWKDQDNKNDKP